jgi:pyruvate kinase
MERRAKIMATLGPVSRDEAALRGLVQAGVDLFRLNLSHGTQEEHRETLRRVRRVAGEEGCHLPVVLDLMGPRYRLGQIPDEPRLLKADQEVVLGTEGSGVDLPVDPEILEHLEPSERVLIDGGLIELRVQSKEGNRVRAKVVNGGPVKTRKGINLPDSTLPFEISEKDRSDIAFAAAEGADYLAASYVGAASHVEAVRAAAAESGGRIPIIAKIERATAIEHLDEITEAADGLMVARGDLGVEVPLYTVPVLQKRIVAAGRLAGKPVIVATQMLESMIEQPRPTRAEATDVANAVFDGADALMLSGETAAGKYPVLVVETMARIIQEAEDYAREQDTAQRSLQPLGHAHARRSFALESADSAVDAEAVLEVPDMVSAAAVYAAEQLLVSRIVAFSQSGFTARLVARYRPPSPIMAFTPDERVARQIQLVWGVRPFVAELDVGSLEDIVQVVEHQLLEARLVRPGERIIILMGHPVRERPLTNLMRVHRIRSQEPERQP